VSEEQLSALLARPKDDAGLREKLKGTAGLDAAVAIAREAGFDARPADWLKHQATQTLQLSDAGLEGVAGGKNDPDYTNPKVDHRFYCERETFYRSIKAVDQC
jgi:predicted ribosomally synthesized peptide with nif11-like leader